MDEVRLSYALSLLLPPLSLSVCIACANVPLSPSRALRLPSQHMSKVHPVAVPHQFDM